MGHLLDGKWTDADVLTENQGGKYVKQPSKFRNWVTADGSSEFKAEPGRYHLYAAITCPWAHRAVLFRVLKKLDGIVTLTDTEQRVGGQGWAFTDGPQLVPGTDHRAEYLHELYTISEPGCTSRVTVPTLWDEKTRKVVSNESSEIIRMFNAEFTEFAPPTADYRPQALHGDIDTMNDKVLAGINNAVNECGRSSSQEAYEQAFEKLFGTLDALDALLGRQRYLCGDSQTEADWRLFPNLIRFDPISYIGYKCNLRRIEDYPNLSNYLRDLYQTPGIAAACDVDGMKRGVFGGAGPIASNGIVPKGPDMALDRPHDRERFQKAA